MFCFTAQGQCSIDWFTIARGGGTSTGGVYSLSGKVGQPDASGQKVLSLEVFNRDYWSQDPLSVAKTGLAKLKAVAEKALA